MVRAYQAYVNFSYEKTDGFDEYFYSDEITDDKIIITSTICGKPPSRNTICRTTR